MVILTVCAVYIYVNDYVDIRQPYNYGELNTITLQQAKQTQYLNIKLSFCRYYSVILIFLNCNVLCVQANYNSFFLHK
jgi:hypothetical protein